MAYWSDSRRSAERPLELDSRARSFEERLDPRSPGLDQRALRLNGEDERVAELDGSLRQHRGALRLRNELFAREERDTLRDRCLVGRCAHFLGDLGHEGLVLLLQLRETKLGSTT